MNYLFNTIYVKIRITLSIFSIQHNLLFVFLKLVIINIISAFRILKKDVRLVDYKKMAGKNSWLAINGGQKQRHASMVRST